MDMERPGPELIGRIVFDLIGVVSMLKKGAAITGKLDEISDLVLKGSDEIGKIVVEKGGDTISVLKGSENLDEIDKALGIASERIIGDVAKEANLFGLSKLTGEARRNAATIDAGIFGQWVTATVKDPDEVTAIFRNMAKLASKDPLERKRAIDFLSHALENPEPIFSEAGIKFTKLVQGMFLDKAGNIDELRFADEFLELQKEGSVQKLWEFVGGKLDDVIDTTFPLVSEAIEAGAKVPFTMRMLSKFDIGSPGKVKQAVNWFSGRAYIGTNPGVAVRGGLYDLFQSVIDTDIGIITKTPGKWAELSTKWLGGIEHVSLTKGFSKAEIKGLEKLALEGTGYKDMPSFFEALKGGKDVSKLDKATLPFARLLQYFEVQSSQRLIGKATDDAMRKILRSDGAFAKVDELVAAGLPLKTADGLVERILSNYGDTELVKKALMSEIGSGNLDLFSSANWLDNASREVLDEFGVTGEFLEAIKSGQPLDDILGDLFKIKDDLIAKTEQLATQHVQAAVDEISNPESVAQVNKALYELVEGGAPLQDLLDKSNDMWAIDRTTKDAWINAGEDLVNQVISHFEGLGDNATADLIRGIRSNGVFDVGQIFAEATIKNKNVMDEVPKWAEKIRKSKPEEMSDIIREVEQIFGIDNLPKDKRAANALWEIMKGDRQGVAFTVARKATAEEFQKVIGLLKQHVPENVLDNIVGSSQKIERANLLERLAVQFDNSLMIDGKLKPVGEYIRALIASNDNTNAIRVLAANSKVTATAKSGSDLFDRDILLVLQQFGIDANKLDDIDPSDAFNAFQEWRNSRGLSKQADALVDILGNSPDVRIHSALSDIHKIINAPSIGADEIKKLFRFIEDNGLGDDIAELKTIAKEALDGTASGTAMDRIVEISKRVHDNILDDIAQGTGKVSSAPATPEMRHLLQKAGVKFGDDITQQDAWRFLYGKADEVPPIIPPFDGGVPTEARNIWERRSDIDATFTKVADGIRKNFGKTEIPEGFTDEFVGLLDNWFDVAKGRVDDARLMSSKYAQGVRDFALHDYVNRYGFDNALSYLFNFHFWPSRTATKWITNRLWNNPAIVSSYMDYRDYMQNIHAESPEWWRYSINSNELLEPLGMKVDNPLYFRLENMIQPIYFMAGADFVDDKKRVNWWTSVIDDVGRFMPGYFNPLIQFSVATALSAKEEHDAAARWAGRLIPSTGLVQSITSIIGIRGGQGIEIDPSVQIYSGGMGPYEKNRVAKTLAGFVKDGKYLEEEIIDAAYSHSGPIWEEAVATQRQAYGVGNIISTFAGINTRQRTQADLASDEFWSDYIRLMALSADMPSDELRYNMEKIREIHPMMDALLLGRKGKDGRDTGYTWSVLSRIRPGNTDDLSEALGLPYDMVSKFYEDKGKFDTWLKADKDQFMSAIVGMGAALELPTSATRKEWAAAGIEYGRMLDTGKEYFSEEIWDRLDMAYVMRDEGVNGNAAFQLYLEENPDVEEAIRWRDRYILENALLSAYYGGQEKLRDYYKGVMYQEIEDALDKNVWNSWTVYWSYVNTGQSKEASAYYKQHPELKKYSELKKEKMAEIEEKILEYSGELPEGADMRLREITDAQTFGEQAAREFVTQPDIVSYTKSEWVNMIGAEETRAAILAWEQVILPQDIISHLQGIAEAYGMTYDELIISIGQAD